MKHLKKYNEGQRIEWGDTKPTGPEVEEIKEILTEMKDELDEFEYSIKSLTHNYNYGVGIPFSPGYRIKYSIPNKLSFKFKNLNIEDSLIEINKNRKAMNHYMDLSNDVLKRLDGIGYQIIWFDTSYQSKEGESEYIALETLLIIKKK